MQQEYVSDLVNSDIATLTSTNTQNLALCAYPAGCNFVMLYGTPGDDFRLEALVNLTRIE